ncbi:hypothetical protein DSM110093_00361 [Sulfitobacter sp. DSM 110093]|uniref:hypothetical protein n=1 Tax=Sulfitobacter sp. DSM 110093 TaxID=2883127 RepID=UPI001FACE530|nr:hypothetical protein [Sulfitobacter sp. DSM 110093]UOA30608.1 hypothetical protein DSM110093_00361 [Sulfitobacter sp. DSM 110093]
MLKRSLILALLAFATPALADPPAILNVRVDQLGDLWKFDVTIRHNDSGWDHYADAWRVLDPDGKPLGTRNLAHPHVQEQPFTRSLSGVRIPEGVTEVSIQARDSVDGWASEIVRVPLR